MICCTKSMLVLCLSLGCSVFAAEYYVDGDKGNDSGPGTAAQPFRTFKHSLSVLKGSDTLHIVPTQKPYTELFGTLSKKHSGTPDKPTVVDGHGAKLSRLTVWPADKFKSEENDIWSAVFPNNNISGYKTKYYKGFPFCFIDGKPVEMTDSKEKLKPGTGYLVVDGKSPDNRKLFLCLEPGKTPADVIIELPSVNNISVGGDYIVVKNITADRNAADSFDSERGKGIVFDNISASWCLNQCISAHSVAGLTVQNSRFSYALDGLAYDVVYSPKEANHITYRNCIFENAQLNEAAGLRGGPGSTYLIESCTFRNNQGLDLSLMDQTKAVIRNCTFIAAPGRKNHSSIYSTNQELIVENCTFTGYGAAVLCGKAGKKTKLVKCRFINCKKEYQDYSGHIETEECETINK